MSRDVHSGLVRTGTQWLFNIFRLEEYSIMIKYTKGSRDERWAEMFTVVWIEPGMHWLLNFLRLEYDQAHEKQ